NVNGLLQATSQSGGLIRVAAGGNVNVLESARIEAHADAGNKAVETLGGVVALSSAGMTRADGSLGTVKLLGGSIDTSGLNGAKDGRVKLRARTEAWLADNSAVKTNFSGLRSLSVEAFKAIPATLTGSVAWVDQDVVDQAKLAVSDLFDASLGASKASLIVQRLKGDQALLQDRTDVRAGIEIQSAGDLTLDTDINLFDWRQGTGNVLAAAPVNLTLRAGGDLNVKASISDGFLDQITRDTTMVSRHDFIQDTQAGDITLVGGADLKAAKVLATRAGTSNGDVIIGDGMGDSARDVLVRTTTGDITVSATRDVNLVNPLAVVYTTGRNAPAGASLELPEMGDFSATIQARIDSVDYSVPPDDDGNYAHKISYLNQDPFTMGGGSVRVEAGRDVIQTSDISKSNNPSVAAQQYVTDWWWRTKDSSDSVSWWSRFDIFQQGFATFGGGNVAIQAGRDTWNVSASAAASGSASSKSQVRYGGGSVSVVAGRDVVGGQVFAADDISVQAGRSLTSQTSSDSSLYAKRVVTPNDTVVMYGNGQTKVLARNDLTIGAVTQAALVKSAMPGAQSANDAVLGMAPSASLNVAAIAGDLTLTGNDVTRYKFSTSYDEQLDGLLVDGLPADVSYSRPDITRITMGLSFPQLLPALASWQAGTGSVSLVSSASSGNLYQLGAVTPTSDGVGVNLQAVSMSAIAGNSLYVRSAIQLGSDELAARPHAVPAGLTILANSLDRDSQASSQLIGGNVNAPMRLVAQSGDVTYGRIDSKQPLRLIAGGDIQAESTDSGIRVQQQGENALTLVQAGRDINLVKTNGYGIDFYGPGDAVIVAGRGINLNQSHGLRAQGNRVNAELPSGSANITVLTGVSFAKGDITSSTNAYFELLGGAGVGDFAADLYAQIKAADQGQAMPTLGSDVARSFSALSVADQLDRAKGLVGDTAFQQRVLTFMQHRDNPALTLPEAITQFNALSDRDKSPMVGMLLASAWSAKVPKDAQLSTALSMAASKRDPYSDELVSFMKQRTGSLVSVGEATQQFMNLRPEEQLLFSTKVLVNEMNLAVSKAASLTGSAKTEAYLDAYNALDAMFPTASVRHADLQMGSSTVQTQQGSEIKVFAPSGGINVGQLTSASSKDKSASDLGLITAGGGNLAVVARDDILVNQSRVFTVGNGDELLWSSTGNVDAGRGGKTVTAAASPVFYLDANGILQADVTAAISGSGIASSGKARIAAPKGEINAGDAGISAGGGLELAATVVRGADNIQAPSIAGAPAAAPVNTAMAAPTPNQPTAAGAKDAADNDDAKSRKRKKRNILLDFLGFGSGSEG
ncbi:MAG: hypothetical protein EPO09_07415, partial [Aquabacterium sp.]|uniref:filamentous haemagglutinin family protein n=1 Tax=Aquabacterium sp. TaxID=1872578 RepID=UPI0011FD5ED0